MEVKLRKYKVLVLRRTPGQSFVIGSENEKIIIKILRDVDGVISIGIDAPKDIPVNRLEVYLKKLKASNHTELNTNIDQLVSTSAF